MDSTPPRSEAERLEIYLALIEAQELHDFTLAQARNLITHRFAISEKALIEIEDEGRDKLWE